MTTNNSINLRASGVVTYDGAGTFSGSTLTQEAILIGGAANALASLGPLTDGQLVVGSTGLTPVAATLTAGTGMSITNGAGTITIGVTGGGLTWTDVTGTTQALAVNNGYTANNAGLVTLTLPATAAYGTIIKVCGKGAGGWLIAQNASQLIHHGDVDSSTGVAGSIASTKQYDTLDLLCTVANTEWTVIGGVGNHTIV